MFKSQLFTIPTLRLSVDYLQCGREVLKESGMTIEINFSGNTRKDPGPISILLIDPKKKKGNLL